ncbi:helix-turn-helix transcriptional regulator [Cyclobacterium marinum]|uniref:Regulatory protein LuxR n=1 Tax=Cyclobacterium marinum (strain ATCC 25205 / DSM 745 / LMG 13164 / NCIMB 1802) TaxID=880070 RepID=G0J7M5_CYCMS|nr:helix-turn-helix transcriptional regulator [Cyclobacterium marinum]AEL26978.1 regulatory protein LuxR [Cyclobacterium marinum DSM 745]
MTVLNTEIHIVTLVFVLLEVMMFSHQLVFYLQKPNEKKRKYYLILLFLLILYNLAGGLFPDEDLPLSVTLQYILAYGAGFGMGAYFPYYFYRAFNITHLEFHAKYGVLIFLILPFVLFFCILYPLGLDLMTVIYVGMIIPFAYAFYMVYNILWGIRQRYKKSKASFDAILSYVAVAPWTLMPLLAYLEVTQLTEVLLTNGGFLVITVLYIRNMVEENKKDLETLNLLQTKNEDEIFTIRCTNLGLTKREIEICELVREGRIYKDIADTLFISERTVNKHMQNIFKKAESNNKFDLLNKITKDVKSA